MSRDDGLTRALIAAIGRGLPLVERPYRALADELGCSERQIIDAIARLADRGDLKRFGVIVRHRKLGYRANGMVVWNIPDARVDAAGRRIGAYACVTLCYRRPRRPPRWNYNLFCMIHGRDRAAVRAQVERIARECDLPDVERDILFSTRCFKQRGAVYQSAESRPGGIGG